MSKVRILFFSDVHGNLSALKSILKTEKYDVVIFAGDFVDYGPHPVECIEKIREVSKYVVMGNHDAAVSFGIDCRCSYLMKDLSIETREAISIPQISEDLKKYMKKLPTIHRFNIDGLSFTLVHASPDDHLYKYVKPSDNSEIEKITRTINSRFLLVGHSHIPFIKKVNNVIVINPGSVGQPRDGDSRASYAIINTDNEYVELKRIKYDINETINALKRFNLKKESYERLVRILKTGKST